MLLPPGIIQDEYGNDFKGYKNYQGFQMGYFYVGYADFVKPSLATTKPLLPLPEQANEKGEHPKGLATSPTFQITFAENVQAVSGGNIKFTAKYTSPNLIVPVTSKEVSVSGSYVVVAPTTDLMPGEVYSITIDKGAFKDMSDNDYDGLSGGYKISTRAELNWMKAGEGQFTERYGMGVAFDRQNKLYMLGGHNGTAGSSGSWSQLNDVWALPTGREVHCASSKQPRYECTTNGEKPDNRNIVTTCSSYSEGKKGTEVIHAGKSNFVVKVWKQPSLVENYA
jgi:hypothetical protein